MKPLSKILIFGIFAALVLNPGHLAGKDYKASKAMAKTSGPLRSIDEAIGKIDAGKLQHSFKNTGELASIWSWDLPTLLRMSSAFYKGYGYLPDLFMMIGVPEGPWTPKYLSASGDSLSMGPTVSEYNVGGDFGPTVNSLGGLHSGNVTIGDVVGPGSFESVPLMATSNLPDSWPETGWPGPWRRIPLEDGTDSVIVGQFTGDKEAFFSINDFDLDNNDFKYAESDDNKNQGYALGIQFDIHVIGYGRSYAEDIIFYPMNVINTTDWNYEGVYLGFYCDIDAPEYNRNSIMNHREDWMAYLARETEGDTTYQYNMSYIYDQESSPYDGPGPIAYTAVKLLETPGNEFDGIDNDEDGLIDEGSDGIDNDGDGLIDENDLSERDMLGLTDWHWFRWENRPGVISSEIQEYEQWKLLTGGSRATMWDFASNSWGPFIVNTQNSFSQFRRDTLSDGQVLTLSSKHNTDDAWFHPNENNVLDPHFDDFTIFKREGWDDLDCVFISSSGPFTLAPKETTTISYALIMGDNLEDLKRNAQVAQLMYNKNYLGADAPNPPRLTAVPGDKKVTLYWDTNSEKSKDVMTAVQDFEGYRLYRTTTDPTNNVWGEKIRDGFGNVVGSIPLAQWDTPNNNIEGSDGNYPYFNLGDDDGELGHIYIDEDVMNGQTYWYTITAYDWGIDAARNTTGNILDSLANAGWANLNSLESAKGNNPDAVPNLVKVIPGVKPADWVAPTGPETLSPDPDIFGKGTIDINLINPEDVIDRTYKIVFHDTIQAGVLHYDLIDETTGDYIIAKSSITKGGDAGKVFNGVHLTIANNENLKFFGTRTPEATFRDITWLENVSVTDEADISDLQVYSLLPDAVGISVDYVVEFVDEANGTLKYPDYSIFRGLFSEQRVPLNVYNITDDPEMSNPLPLYVFPDFGSPWQSGEEIGIYDPGFVSTTTPNNTNVNWSFKISWGGTVAADSSEEPPIPSYVTKQPQKGDVIQFRTYKPFLSGDVFTFSTVSAGIAEVKEKALLDDVRVVPNPFVVWSEWSYDGGGERIAFTNLPAKSTIYVYTSAGDLVKKLVHESLTTGTLFWNMLNESNQSVAYGLYVYVVEAEDGQSKIGKFALIK